MLHRCSKDPATQNEPKTVKREDKVGKGRAFANSKRREFTQSNTDSVQLLWFFLKVSCIKELFPNNLGSERQSWCYSLGFKRLEVAQR